MNRALVCLTFVLSACSSTGPADGSSPPATDSAGTPNSSSSGSIWSFLGNARKRKHPVSSGGSSGSTGTGGSGGSTGTGGSGGSTGTGGMTGMGGSGGSGGSTGTGGTTGMGGSGGVMGTGGAKPHHFCGWVEANGNVTPDQDPGYTTFAAHASEMDAVHPVWYSVTGATTFHNIYGVDDPTITSHTTLAGQKTLLIPMVAAVDSGGPQLIDQILNDTTLEPQHVQALVQLAVSKKYDGLDLDYEHLPDSDRAAFSKFAADLATAMHAQGKTLSFAVQGITSAVSVYDYDALSAVADQLHIMGYDYHFLGSHLGPVSPLGWLQQITAYVNSIAGGTRSAKFILGLPNYGLAGPSGGNSSWFGTLADSAALAGSGYATTTTHMTTCPFGNQAPGRAPNAMTSQGQLYFDDLASLEEKVTLAQTAKLGGITYWTMGGEPGPMPGTTTTFFQMVRSHFPAQ